jgi:hypothetical protein
MSVDGSSLVTPGSSERRFTRVAGYGWVIEPDCAIVNAVPLIVIVPVRVADP